MTRTEWKTLADRLRALWPATDFTPANEVAYFAVLERFDTQVVTQAIDSSLDRSIRMLPSCAELLTEVRGVIARDLPTPETAVEWCLVAVGRFSADEQAGLRWLSDKAPEVSIWARAYGWRRLRTEPIFGDDGHIVRLRLEASWSAFAAASRTDLTPPRAWSWPTPSLTFSSRSGDHLAAGVNGGRPQGPPA